MLMQFIVNRSSAICWCSQHVSSVIYNLNVYEPVQPFNNDFLPLHFCHGKSTLEFCPFMQMRRKCAAREVSSKIHQIQEECVRAALCSHTQNQIRGKTKKAPNSQICWELNSIKRKRVATSIVDNDHQYVNTCMHDRWFVFFPIWIHSISFSIRIFGRPWTAFGKLPFDELGYRIFFFVHLVCAVCGNQIRKFQLLLISICAIFTFSLSCARSFRCACVHW